MNTEIEITEEQKTEQKQKEVVLSGIRATGRLHFGNYLGAVRHFVEYQSGDKQCMYFIADWHSLTETPDAKVLRSNLIEMVMDYIAAGLDPEKSILYAQSSVPEIAELCLCLGMLQPLSQLQGLATVKDLIKNHKGKATLGIITYPVLMAADILGPKATIIPVGGDQTANVELARDLARYFNNRYGETFPLPSAIAERVRVPGLDGSKMGKSNAGNAVDIGASVDEIRQRYLKDGVTDPDRKTRSSPGNPRNCQSVYPLHELLLSDEELIRVDKQCRGAEIGCVECKNFLVDNLAKLIEPFQARRRELEGKHNEVADILHEGGKRARKIIAQTAAEVRDKMGIVIY